MQLLSDRQHNIITLARTLGRMSVDDLSARFDVTPQTIRRDLNELCERRVLTRTHGGAVVSSCVENLSYDARRFIAAAEKKAIGIAAVALIPNKSSLFINIGTTAEEVAAALANHDALLVVTKSSWSAIARSSSGRRPSSSATYRRSTLSSPTGWISAALRQVCKVHGVNNIETDAGAPADQ